jgi:hypothetical protein
MKITKRTIDKAINFLETIPEEGFCKGAYSKGDRHCSVRWLFHNGNSPFSYYDAADISVSCNDHLGAHLTLFNDEAPEGQIKATVINALCLLKCQL